MVSFTSRPLADLDVVVVGNQTPDRPARGLVSTLTEQSRLSK
jgi:hypothetical protein